MAKIIKATELKTARRGRKAIRIPSVLDAMRGLKAGEAIVLDEYGEVTDDERSKVYQNIRAHWGDVRTEACRITFDPDTNYACVQIKAVKTPKAMK